MSPRLFGLLLCATSAFLVIFAIVQVSAVHRHYVREYKAEHVGIPNAKEAAEKFPIVILGVNSNQTSDKPYAVMKTNGEVIYDWKRICKDTPRTPIIKGAQMNIGELFGRFMIAAHDCK